MNFATIKKGDKSGRGSADESEDPESLRERSLAELARLDFPSGDQLSSLTLFLRQFAAMFLKRWYSFKRDWRMWLITVLPSALIWCLLVLGFQREYVPAEDMRYSHGLIGS